VENGSNRLSVRVPSRWVFALGVGGKAFPFPFLFSAQTTISTGLEAPRQPYLIKSSSVDSNHGWRTRQSHISIVKLCMNSEINDS
jgi:hypothetical protein